jgi:hypothetical protein
MQSGAVQTLAIVSCLFCGGCAHAVSPVVAVPARDVEAIVDEYSATRRITVRVEDGRSLLVTPEREPLLVVDERVVVPGDVNPGHFEAEAPLTEARRFGDALYFGRRRVVLANVARARLVPVGRRWAVYGGAGGAVLAAVGERDPCGNEPGCVESSTFPFAYFRAGASLRLGADRRDVIGLDAGLWSGLVVDSGPEGQVVNKEPRTWPMAGLSYHRAL